jgi:hypothetical protein
MFHDLTANIRRMLALIQQRDPEFYKRATHVIEIGCFHGTTTNLLVDTFQQHNPEGFQNVTCVDPWSDDYQELGNVPWNPVWNGQYTKFQENTQRNVQKIDVRRGPSQQVVPTLNGEKTFDFAYIDGEHTEAATYTDAINVLPMMKPGSYILFDDYLWGDYNNEPDLTPKRAVDRFVEDFKDRVEVVHQDFQFLVRVK